jgi:uncharacterized protein YdeI (YjbR/CyaY-like superfamily)
MTAVNAKADAFFKEAKKWKKEMGALRAIMRECPLEETYKWRSPCYTFDGGNIAAIWGLKDYCALAFFKGALLKDSKEILSAPGAHSRSMRLVKFTGAAEIEKAKPLLKKYIGEAIEAEKAGLKIEFAKDDLPFPAELTAALKNDSKLKKAFEELTPGRRRGYVLHFSQAKQAKTREARIEKAAPKILAGKGLQDR